MTVFLILFCGLAVFVAYRMVKAFEAVAEAQEGKRRAMRELGEALLHLSKAAPTAGDLNLRIRIESPRD